MASPQLEIPPRYNWKVLPAASRKSGGVFHSRLRRAHLYLILLSQLGPPNQGLFCVNKPGLKHNLNSSSEVHSLTTDNPNNGPTQHLN